MSTGHFSPLDKFDKSNFLLIRIHKIIFNLKIKGEMNLHLSLWWEGVDSNHRSRWRQIYSLFPLATREPSQKWSWWLESNPQPADYKSAALPVELHQRWNLVPRGGIEPPTQGFSVPCSTYWATEAYKLFLKMLAINTSIFIWRPGRGSNPRPPAWQAGVLTICTTGPNIYDLMVGLHGLEPRTNRLWADRSNLLS